MLPRMPFRRSSFEDYHLMRHVLAGRLAFFYASYFAVIGIHLPFWPVWLEQARGLSPETIGLLLGAMSWPKVVTNVAIARYADRLGARRGPMVLLAAATLAAFALFGIAESFWALLLLSLASGVTLAAILPLGEALALAEAKVAGIGYARVRLWGSIAFILAALGGGRLLEALGPSAVLVLLLATLTLILTACGTLPGGRLVRTGEKPRLKALWRQRDFVHFALAAALLHGSHGVYYGFATIHWRSAGLGDTAIGWLWAEGVIAEILLFLWAGGLLERAGPRRVLMIAAALAAVRWGMSGLSTGLFFLVVVQTLHAASFGAAHLAAMQYLRDAIPAELHATAQGGYAALSALLFGILMPLSGWLYAAIGGQAFFAMAVVAVAAAALAATAAQPGTSSGAGSSGVLRHSQKHRGR